jgi:ATP-dependent Zn protease
LVFGAGSCTEEGFGWVILQGILISGPPGTGKTLLARAIARESGLPFVFASGAEFVESSTGNGSDKVFDIFFTARANAPSFVFIDEIDALAGKNVNDDAERRATFQQLLSELDGEYGSFLVHRLVWMSMWWNLWFCLISSWLWFLSW